jgi:catechol 2,3-dioxygenase-like lactoylglutathione lyase family enzyme
MDRSIRFYQDLFGFETETRDEFFCVFRVPGHQALILFPKEIAHHSGRASSPSGAVEGLIPPHGGGGRLHFAFAIPATQLEAWERRLASRRIPVESKVHWQRGGCSLYFRDPDEHLVELITPGIWSFY